ncbi:deaminase [Allosaccharopolyspora coralli]|uniref:Deaminase n=1 Tax=Allosaccharopolyspora coralli TaxID=2665642 RepID=A0A5Q3QCR3_9PSEU|nr:dihydrofolate reductase family protein [Allosaccharopolyspora coralli]QGK69329.1 deaminase [Allosaccharopolyspora coralli]
MAKLIYSAIMSLDGYIADENGNFDWAVPDDELHEFVNDLERPIGTHLFGRRMYETMLAWETMGGPDDPAQTQDFAELWHATDKIVYSTTLDATSTARTQLEREFNPDAVHQLKELAPHDLSVSGPGLATHAFHAGLVDEVRLFVIPVLVGGGTRALPDGVRLRLNLTDERRFDTGTVYLCYGITPS